MKLDEAIEQQIVRFSDDEEPTTPNDAEVRNLLQAFISLITAYLGRLDGSDSSGRTTNLTASVG